MLQRQVILDPFNEVILECTLDSLVQEVGGEQFVNVCTRELHHEGLSEIVENLVNDTNVIDVPGGLG